MESYLYEVIGPPCAKPQLLSARQWQRQNVSDPSPSQAEVRQLRRTYILTPITFTGASNANESISISICQPGPDAPQALSNFHPEFTELFFGQNQSIFGYRNLAVDLRFAAHDLYPNVKISYDEKFKSVGETKATNLPKILKEYLPQCMSIQLRC